MLAHNPLIPVFDCCLDVLDILDNHVFKFNEKDLTSLLKRVDTLRDYLLVSIQDA